MAFFLGTDEAGFGPNLGPLVVSATAWESNNDTCESLADRLAAVLADRPAKNSDRIAIADSKKLYPAGGGLSNLEGGLFAALALLGREPRTWRSIWTALAPGSLEPVGADPWHAGFEAELPVDAPADRLPQNARLLDAGLQAAGVRLLDLQSRAVFPQEFNRLLDRFDSKGALLSHVTLDLAARMIERLPAGRVVAVCDKHGGRNRYLPVLYEAFPDRRIEPICESRELSAYRFPRSSGDEVEIRFQVRGERFPPTALASMASKYLRELAMLAWNRFWCARIDGLRPTAGYPEDAKRFWAEIAAEAQALNLPADQLWRRK